MESVSVPVCTSEDTSSPHGIDLDIIAGSTSVPVEFAQLGREQVCKLAHTAEEEKKDLTHVCDPVLKIISLTHFTHLWNIEFCGYAFMHLRHNWKLSQHKGKAK